MSNVNQLFKKRVSPNSEEIPNDEIIYEPARKFMFDCNGLTINQINDAAKLTVDYF